MGCPYYWQPEPIVAMLEVLASERTEFLAVAVEVLRNSVAAHAVRELAKRWGVEAENLPRELRIAIAKLNGLERRRGRWSVADRGLVIGVGRDVSIPRVRLVSDLAAARAGRVSLSRSEKLRRIIRKLEDAAEFERTAKMVKEFLSEPESEQRQQA